MMRAAIYARYSSELQSEASIEDQIRVCQRLARERGFSVVATYSDAAISGTSLNRPDFQRMQTAAQSRAFDVIIAESLDRLSRDQAHLATLYKTMQYRNIQIVTASDGLVNPMHVGFKGVMSALFLADLAAKTRRGLEGRVAIGKFAGGNAYGYRIVRDPLPDGSLTTGERVIHQDEATVVRRIFKDYAAGLSARRIAAALNDEGVPTPRSGHNSQNWGASTISGNYRRGTGILNNELYVGYMVWNRQTFVQNPISGKREARLNPPEAWQTSPKPELRIIDQALWDAVKARQIDIRERMNPAGDEPDGQALLRAKRPVALFSGLLKCACCGASYVLIGNERYGCASPRNKGKAVCTNRRTIKRNDIEARVLNGLQHVLLRQDLLDAFTREYTRSFNEAAAERSAAFERFKRELKAVETKIEATVTAIVDGMYHPSMKEKMDSLDAEQARLKALLREQPAAPALRLHPGMAKLYQEKIANLAQALNKPTLRPYASELLRSLISEIRLTPDRTEPHSHRVELHGALAGILRLAEDDAEIEKPPRFAEADIVEKSIKVVAGAGFEPAAFRL